MQVVIWSKSWCGYCGRTKALFGQPAFRSVDVKVHELDQNPDGDAIQHLLGTLTGQRTVPSVWVAGKFVGGNDAVQEAYRNGELHKMLGLQK